MLYSVLVHLGAVSHRWVIESNDSDVRSAAIAATAERYKLEPPFSFATEVAPIDGELLPAEFIGGEVITVQP